jgi:hypothetical protein
MNTKSAILSAATLLAAIVLNPAGAMAETVGTGCLAKLGGEIYNLAPYRSAPSKNCRNGDQKIRLSFHQPSTAFAKRSQFSNEPRPLPEGAMASFNGGDLQIFLAVPADDPPFPDGDCALVAIDWVNDYRYLIASVPPGAFQEGLDTVMAVEDQDDVVVRTYKAHRTLFLETRDALMFHDLIIDYGGAGLVGGGACFASFFVEYAADPLRLYDK